jgi:repressor LexA
MSETSDLTDRQARILAFIRSDIEEHGWAPSNREIGHALGISSTAVVAYNLRQLERLGYIVLGGKARQIRIITQRGS